MNTSQKGIDLIKLFEATRLTAYNDPVGLLTIGTGHLVKAGEPYKLGTKITQAQSDELLRKDLATAEKSVNNLQGLNQNQFDALVSFVFNIGGANFKISSVYRFLTAKPQNFDAAAYAMLKWNKARDPKTKQLKILKGLVRRREAEKALFQSK